MLPACTPDCKTSWGTQSETGYMKLSGFKEAGLKLDVTISHMYIMYIVLLTGEVGVNQ